jgi:hypothetical protein
MSGEFLLGHIFLTFLTLHGFCNKTAKTGTQYISPRTKPAPPLFTFHLFYATIAALCLTFFKNTGCFYPKPGPKPLF